ncbi:MAG: hypothetical protein KYX62_09040 [Pseudomonadota bacterium]|nr:hypothetical protein [Pseudomonadota bacterium]
MKLTIHSLLAAAVLAGNVGVQAAGSRADYDLDDNGLIEINDLADLYEIRNNPDGTTLYGSSDGCPENTGCNGFELTTDLDFDTNRDGLVTAADDYYNWSSSGTFSGIFEGNGHLIRNLQANYGTGLFYHVEGGTIRNLGLDGTAMSIRNGNYKGALINEMTDTTVSKVFSTGPVSGGQRIGGLVGRSYGASVISDSFSTGSVTATTSRAGGIVGQAYNITISNTYATGAISSANIEGGIVGELNGTTVVSNSHWATDTTGQSSSAKKDASSGYLGATLAELQCPTSASDTSCVTGTTLYDGWSSDNWDFGSTEQMPALVMNGEIYRDSDGDGAVDRYDDFADNAAAALDTDGDGMPDNYNSRCDSDCQNSSGLTLDDDNDGDGVSNEDDAFPQNLAASADTDGDGQPDDFNDGCDSDCQNSSGLTLDNDIDGDGVTNDNDPDNSADNGAPEFLCVPDPYSIAANSENGDLLLITREEMTGYLSEFCLYDAVDDSESLTIQGYIDGAALALSEDDEYQLPTGAVAIDWVLTDTAGNNSETATTVLNIYPQLRFALSESLTGEPSNAQITVALTGVSPQYPVTIEYAADTAASTATQQDIDSSFDITATRTVVIEAGDDGDNTTGTITVPVLADSSTEVDETLILSLSGAVVDEEESNYFAVNESNSSHTLTITEANIAPQVSVTVSQNGELVSSINPQNGAVTLSAGISDGNGNDTHTLQWNLDSLNVTGNENGTSISFATDELEDGEYDISVTVTDSGNTPLSTTQELTLDVETPPATDDGDSNADSGSSSGGGAASFILLLLPLLLVHRRRYL